MPTPTKPVAGFSDEGQSLIQALLNDRIQKRACEHHGFRSSATLGGRIDPSKVPVPDLPSQLSDILQMPTYSAVLQLTDENARTRGDSLR